VDDQQIQAAIEELVTEEQRLLHAHEGEGLDPDEHRRMQELSVQLDQLWDLLRQRRARRDAGLDPEGARERDPSTVEDYRQ
jgi:uncharacterized protein DUF2630